MTDFVEQTDLTVMNHAVVCIAETQQACSGNNIDINDMNELFTFVGVTEDNGEHMECKTTCPWKTFTDYTGMHCGNCAKAEEHTNDTEEKQTWIYCEDEDDDGYDDYNDDTYVPKRLNRIYCDNCKTQFSTEEALIVHNSYLCWLNTKSYDCKYCGEHFETLADFIRHDEDLCIKNQLLELKETGYDEYHTDNYVHNPREYEEDDEEDDEEEDEEDVDDYIKDEKKQEIMERRRYKWTKKM